MRLKRYLIERALVGKKKELNIIKKALLDGFKNYKPTGESFSRLAWIRYISKIENEVNKKIPQVEFNIDEPHTQGVRAGVRVGDIMSEFDFEDKPFLLSVYVDEKSMYKWFEEGNKKDFETFFLKPVLNDLEHELVHIEQFRRLIKNKDPLKAIDIVTQSFLRMKTDKKFKDEYDAYLSSSDEVMAHAQTADVELRTFPAQLVLDWMKDSHGMRELADVSQTLDNYYIRIKHQFPKVYKRFIKYMVQYVQKRAKKELKNKKIQADYAYYSGLE